MSAASTNPPPEPAPASAVQAARRALDLTPTQRILLVSFNYIPFLNLLFIATLALLPAGGYWPKWTWIFPLLWLLLVPPLIVNITLRLFPLPTTPIPLDSKAFFVWWFTAQWQVIFNRLPFLDELIRLVPGLYSTWLRLWGAKIGKLIYWTPGLRILDRSLVHIGNHVVFGVGVRINPHLILPLSPSSGNPGEGRGGGSRQNTSQINSADTGQLVLLAAPVRIGDEALVGGYSLLFSGSWIAAGEKSPGKRELRPFGGWENGKRVAPPESVPNTHEEPKPDLPRKIFARVRSHWPMKLWIGAALGAFFGIGYGSLQRLPFGAPITLPLTVIDKAIAFSPGWVWIYESLWLLLALPWLAETRDQLRRYARGMLIAMTIGYVCFLFWPVTGPRPANIPTTGLYAQLIRIDTPLNCFPSLHIALAALSACFVLSITSGSLKRILAIVFPLWIALIAYSTIATRQHYFIDLPPGLFLGWSAYWLTSRSAQPAPLASAAVSRGVA